jgi:molybdopterin converting factor small subunit
MSIKIDLHPNMYHLADNQKVVEVQGNTVAECLNILIQRYPGVKDLIFDKTGKLNRWTEIYVNAESAYPDELAKEVKDGDDIQILLILAGG